MTQKSPIKTYWCTMCGKPSVTYNNGSICDSCMDTTIDEKKTKFLKKLNELNIEERLRKVEEWLFRHEIKERLNHDYKIDYEIDE